jgi:hypothetical protein
MPLVGFLSLFTVAIFAIFTSAGNRQVNNIAVTKQAHNLDKQLSQSLEQEKEGLQVSVRR